MRIFDYLIISSRRLLRNKNSILYIILIMIAVSSIIFNISFKNSFENYISNYTMKNVEFRVYDANYGTLLDKELDNDISNIYKMTNVEAEAFIQKVKNKAINYVSQLSHVVGVDIEGNGYMVNIDKIEYNGEILFENEFLIGIPRNAIFNLVDGVLLSNYEVNEKVMICPNYFQTDYGSNVLPFDAKSLLNKNITLSFKEKKVDYKIVGLYDKISTYSIGDKCYTSYENVNEINRENVIEEKNINDNYIGLNGFAFMIDSVENLETVKNELLDYGIIITPMAEIDTSLVYNIEKICNIITIITFVSIMLIAISNLVINIKKNGNEYFIYNCLGYRKLDIFIIELITNIINGVIGYFLSIILSVACIKILKNSILIHNERLYLLNQQIDTNCLIIGLCVAIIIPSIISLILLINNKYIKNNILE